MKGNKGLMVIAVLASLAFCFLNELRYALIVLVLSFWFLNDVKTTSWVLQPIVVWISARIFYAFFSFLLGGISDLIAAFGKFNTIDTDILKFLSPLCSLWIVIFLTLCIIYFAMNKQVPLYGKFCDRVSLVLHNKRNPKDVAEE